MLLDIAIIVYLILSSLMMAWAFFEYNGFGDKSMWEYYELRGEDTTLVGHYTFLFLAFIPTLICVIFAFTTLNIVRIFTKI